MYWVIYYHTGLLESYRAKSFNDGEELQEWIGEMKGRITVVDIAESLDQGDEEE